MKKNGISMKFLTLIGLFIGAFFMLSGFAAAQEEEAEKVPLELDGSKWAIVQTLVEKSGKTSTVEDTLNFENKKFYSEVFRDKEYEPTNYSVSLNDDGTTKFGTMQNKDEETVYWEGRVKGETIDGTINVYSKKAKGIREEYYFNGTRLSGELKPKVMPKPTADGPVQVAPSLMSKTPGVQEEAVQPIIEDAQEPAAQTEDLQLIGNE